MKISEQIDQIIETRHQRLPLIDQKENMLDEMEGQLDQLDYLKNQMITSDGEIRPDGKYAMLLNQNPDMAWNLQGTDTTGVRTALQETRKRLDECRRRFGRESISISVVGEARKGKSTLLQSISGLDDQIIPAFDSTDCTGAPSTLYNCPDDGVKAILNFKSRRAMTDMAQVYLDRLIPDAADRIQIGSMEQIRDLDMNAILEKVPAGHPGGIVQPYLRKLIEHYDEWSVYAGRTEPLILTDKQEIASFVAQNNGVSVGKPGRVEYYRYLAAEKCEIYCRFPEVEAGKINLVDTVGLGDHTVGILEGMVHTVEEESDAVVFLIMPQNGAGGGIPKPVSDIYSQIAENCKERDLDKWLYYLINHVEKPSDAYAVNTQFCNSAVRTLKDSRFFGSDHAWVINGKDSEAVRRDFLLPMLTELAGNLEQLDQRYVQKVNEALKQLQMEYGLLCKKAQKVLQSDFNRNATLFPVINRLTEEGYKNLRGSLFRLSSKWAEKSKQPCPVIYDAAENILQRMQQEYLPDSYIPNKNEIKEQLATGAQPHQIYIDQENRIRNAISDDFLNVNVELQDFVNRMKDELADTLCGECGLGMILRPDDTRPLREWLKDFSDQVLDETGYPNLKLAFDTIYDFDFSVKGFLTYEVRDELSGLDPSRSNVPALVNNQANLIKTAGNIQVSLLGRMCAIASDLKERLELLFCKPNMAMSAEISEFYDRVIYADGAELEWRIFFSEKAGILWADELRKYQETGVLCREWLDLVDALAAKNRAVDYILQ